MQISWRTFVEMRYHITGQNKRRWQIDSHATAFLHRGQSRSFPPGYVVIPRSASRSLLVGARCTRPHGLFSPVVAGERSGTTNGNWDVKSRTLGMLDPTLHILYLSSPEACHTTQAEQTGRWTLNGTISGYIRHTSSRRYAYVIRPHSNSFNAWGRGATFKDADGRIILKVFLNKLRTRKLGSSYSGQGPVTGIFKQGNETSHSTERWVFFDNLNDNQLLKKDFVLWCLLTKLHGSILYSALN